MELEGKAALVTGATSGIGFAIAHRFLDEGAYVCGCGRRKFCEIEESRFFYLRGDLTCENDTRKIAEGVLSRLGKLDILVNCAGVTGIGSVFDTSPAEFKHQFEVNVFGLYNITHELIPAILQSKGTIINIGSELGAKAIAERIAYCPSKAAVEMLTRCLAIECGPYVRVNGILPGLTETPMTRNRFTQAKNPSEARHKAANRYVLKRLCHVEDVADAAVFLASSRSSFITGDMIAVCGGGQFTTCH